MKKYTIQKWFIIENGSQKGPLAPEIILDLLEQNEVTLQTQLVSEENPGLSITVADLKKSSSDPMHTLFDALHLNKDKKSSSFEVPSKISDPSQKMWVGILIAACCILTLFIIVLIRSGSPKDEERSGSVPTPQESVPVELNSPPAENSPRPVSPAPPSSESRDPSSQPERFEENRYSDHSNFDFQNPDTPDFPQNSADIPESPALVAPE